MKLPSAWKNVAKGMVPPALLPLLKRRRSLGFVGDYPTWKAAAADCTGYDLPLILERVSDATQAVVDGRAVYERDSVLFDEPDYNWPLLTILQKIAREAGNRLRVADFGGSLGSTYRQCRDFLDGIAGIEWMVVEQKAFVERGRERFQNGELTFHPDLASCGPASAPTCLLLSGVLQYLEDPYGFLADAVGMGFQHIVLDRTPLSVSGADRIVKQIVPPEIYPASYPARLLSRSRLLSCLEAAYRLEAEFPALDRFDSKADFRGFLCTLKARREG